MNRNITLTFLALLLPVLLLAQESEEQGKDKRPVRPQFESGYLIDNQTVVIKQPATLEFIIQHRFGNINSETFDLLGLYAPSNIRMGLNYVIRENILIGIGSTKNNKLQDANVKWNFLQQTRSNSMPVSAALFAEAAYDAREDIFENSTQRLSYFSQLIIARSFGRKISVQLAPSYSHFNIVDSLVEHSNIGVSFNGRYKFSAQSSVIYSLDYNITQMNNDFENTHPNASLGKPNLSLGVEISTSSHAFQIFLTTYNSLIPQYNMLYNRNDFTEKDILLGFNITRLWNFQKSK
jgi:hypothetical protein